MCGIAGEVGRPGTQVQGTIVELLSRLENRGYDGSGLVTMTEEGHMHMVKRGGKLARLTDALKDKRLEGSVGIGHTRWGTHGPDTDENAHPHLSCDGRVALVHNGQIQNHEELRNELIAQGFTFTSAVDSEVLVNLILREYKRKAAEGVTKYLLEQAVASAIRYLKTTEFAIVVLSKDSPRELVIARRIRPIVLGIENGEYYIASERLALAGKVKTVLDHIDNTVATISCEDGVHVEGLSAEDIDTMWEPIGIEAEEKTKGNHATFLKKEIFDQPKSIRAALEGRVNPDTLQVRLGMFEGAIAERMQTIDNIVLVASGTSHNAAQVAMYYFEQIAGVRAKCVLGSEFPYALRLVDDKTVVIGISQSGETADTVAALLAAKKKGALTLGVTNAPGSQIARLVSAGVFLKAGIEISVASTKAFTSQATVLLLMALETKMLRGEKQSEEDRALLRALLALPNQVEHALSSEEVLKRISLEIAGDIKRRLPSGCPMFIGAGYAVPWTYEAALKFLELNYTGAEGRAAGEFKHGYLAMVEKGVKVFAAIFPDGNQDRVITNCEQIKSKGGVIIALDATGDPRVLKIAHTLICVPCVPEALIPIIVAPYAQLIALHVAEALGYDPDQPRNLAKSVTVE